MKEIYKELKRHSEQLTIILFFAAAALSFIYHVANFGGGFLPVMGNLFTMILRVSILLVVPVLLSIGKKNEAKWAFLGVSAYWVITTLFELLNDTGVARNGNGALAGAMGAFAFLIACAMIVMTVFAILSKYKDSEKWKVIALAVYCGTLLLFVVFFALHTAVYAKWKIGTWDMYFEIISKFLILPFAMLFAALTFWFDGSELDAFDNSSGKKKSGAKRSAPVSAEESKTIFFEETEEEEEGYEELEESEPEAPVTAPAKKESAKAEGKSTEKKTTEKKSEKKPEPQKAEESPAPAPQETPAETSVGSQEEVAFEAEFEEEKTEEPPVEEVNFESDAEEEKPEEKPEEKGEAKSENDEEDDFLKAFLEE